MDEREAKARGLIDTLEVTVEVDHVRVQIVLARRTLGLKSGEIERPVQKVFHPVDSTVERLMQEAVREVGQQLRGQSDADDPR